MGLKITAGDWLAANDENRVQRDAKRRAFYAQLGIKPTASLRDIAIPLAARHQRISGLFDSATGARVGGDQELAGVIALLKQEIAMIGLASPDLAFGQEHQSFGLLGASPEAFVKFFNIDLETSLGRSFMG